MSRIEVEELVWAEVWEKFQLTNDLRKRIRAEQKGKDWAGVEECPACGGRLHMSHAACNGYIHGNCETEGCLRWME